MDYVRSHREAVACEPAWEVLDGARQCVLRREMKEEEIGIRGVLWDLNEACLV
jgi:hypothetical protein